MGFNTFKRHLTRAHSNNVEDDVEMSNKFSETSQENFPFIDDGTSQNNSSQTNYSVDEFEKSILKLILSLHDNSNFSRKDVIDVFKKIEEFVVTPIFRLLEKSLRVDSSEFKSTRNTCRSILKKFASEHNLIEMLKKRKLIDEVDEFIIDSQINVENQNAKKQEYLGL